MSACGAREVDGFQPFVGQGRTQSDTSIVEGKPLGKRELIALAGDYKAKGTRVHVDGTGINTLGRLEARGFIEPTGDGLAFVTTAHAVRRSGVAAPGE